ncbi:MAG TPA: glutamate racemase [Chthoniobacteraceae bacterium]|nr:glutamate racemase [Chthoniobacteraceae bacterium]
MPKVQPPIGVFDSGIGGLTVAAAMRDLLPAENIFYIGDTARVPYGGKSRETIERYSREIGGMLVTEDAKVIVVACNTASALGIPAMREKFATPIVGVIDPGARAALEATKNGRIGVIGTRATIYSRAYERAIQALDKDVHVISAPCPLFVPMIEEGWLDDAITDQTIRRYIEPLVRDEIDTLVLGCTHYPLLRASLQRFVGNDITLVDSAQNCALAVKDLLKTQRLQATKSNIGRLTVALTDHSTPFLRVAEEALGLQVGDVHLRQVQGAVV